MLGSPSSRAGRLALVVAALFALTGCPSMNSFRTARALDPGQLQLTGSAEALGMVAPTSSGLGGARPSIGFGARYGVAGDVDVGVKLAPIAGVSVDSTFQLSRGKVDLALGPGLAYFATPVPVGFGAKTVEQLATSPDYTIVATTVPLLAGLNVGRGHQLVLGPTLAGWFVQPQGSQPGGGAVTGGVELLAGSSAGVSIKVSGNVRLVPAFVVMAPLAWTGVPSSRCDGAACAPIERSAAIVQGGIAVTVGPDALGP